MVILSVKDSLSLQPALALTVLTPAATEFNADQRQTPFLLGNCGSFTFQMGSAVRTVQQGLCWWVGLAGLSVGAEGWVRSDFRLTLGSSQSLVMEPLSRAQALAVLSLHGGAGALCGTPQPGPAAG